MKDGVFSVYQARGATARADFIIDRATGDANPLQCVGQSFVTIDPLRTSSSSTEPHRAGLPAYPAASRRAAPEVGLNPGGRAVRVPR